MTRIILSNKPLVEAIFELRWVLQETEFRIKEDPHYSLLVGSLYDKIKDRYPYHEKMPIINIPENMTPNIVRQRFRTKKDGWPLVQIGPGILTVNNTESYVWETFEEEISHIIRHLFSSYPNLSEFKVDGLLLRYIDGITFNYDEENIYEFLSEKMRTEIKLYDKLFDNTGVDSNPKTFDLRFSFHSSSPKGQIDSRFVRAKKDGDDGLVWETIVRTTEDSPSTEEGILSWVREAHDLCDDWFFKTIEGELLERFR